MVSEVSRIVSTVGRVAERNGRACTVHLRGPNRWLRVAALGLALAWVLPAARALATPMVDQQSVAVTSDRVQLDGVFNFGIAQTFTVGVTGSLASVEVEVGRGSAVTEDLVLYLLPTNPEVLGSLGTVYKPAVDFEGDAIVKVAVSSSLVSVGSASLLSIDLSSFAVDVTAGDHLALALRAPGVGGGMDDAYFWSVTSSYPVVGGPYSGGHQWLDIDPPWTIESYQDMNFRTFVEIPAVPEPAASVAYALGLATIAVALRRLRRVPDRVAR